MQLILWIALMRVLIFQSRIHALQVTHILFAYIFQVGVNQQLMAEHAGAEWIECGVCMLVPRWNFTKLTLTDYIK